MNLGVWKTARMLVFGIGLAVVISGCGGDDDDAGSGPAATRTPVASAPTATRTHTPQPGAPTATPTPTRPPSGGDTGNVEAVIANILPNITRLTGFGALAGGGTSGPRAKRQLSIPVPCPAGGTLSFSCNNGTTQIEFDQCSLSAQQGAPGVFIDGTFQQTVSGACFSVPAPGSPIRVAFAGRIRTTNPITNQSIDVSFDTDVTVTNQADGTTLLSYEASVDDDCLGTVQVQTLEQVVIPSGAACPTAGRVRVTVRGETYEVRFTAGGGVEIFQGGSLINTLASCQDASTAACN